MKTLESVFNASEADELKDLKKHAIKWRKWLDHYMPFLQVADERIVIAGGAFASRLQDEEIKDVDIFFLDMAANSRIMIQTEIKARRPDYKSAPEEYRQSAMNDNLIDVMSNGKKGDAQFIFTKYKTREELIEHFDFLHTCISFHQDKLYLTREAYDCAKKKLLKVNGKKKVHQWRVEKFKSKGYTVPEKMEFYKGYELSEAKKKVVANVTNKSNWITADFDIESLYEN